MGSCAPRSGRREACIYSSAQPFHEGSLPEPDRALGREGAVPTQERGFASMDAKDHREIASKGGKAAHAKGAAHEWTQEDAGEAGREGGMLSHRREPSG